MAWSGSGWAVLPGLMLDPELFLFDKTVTTKVA